MNRPAGMADAEYDVLRSIADRFPFPSRYLVCDAETSGLAMDGRDVIVDIGTVTMTDGQEEASSFRYLDWSDSSAEMREQLQERLQKARESITERGGFYPYTWELLSTQGQPGVSVLQELRERLVTCAEAGIPVVSFGWHSFVTPRLDLWAERCGISPFPWDSLSYLDLGLVEKAIQMRAVPEAWESLPEWQRRVAEARAAGVRWSLVQVCVPKYGLQLQAAEATGSAALRDCRMIAALMEVYRNATEAVPEGI